MVKIECLLCEKPIKLPKYVDTENYDGEVVCQECQSLLYIKLVKSKVQKYRVKERGFRGMSTEEVVQMLQTIQERKKLPAEEHKQNEESQI